MARVWTRSCRTVVTVMAASLDSYVTLRSTNASRTRVASTHALMLLIRTAVAMISTNAAQIRVCMELATITGNTTLVIALLALRA